MLTKEEFELMHKVELKECITYVVSFDGNGYIELKTMESIGDRTYLIGEFVNKKQLIEHLENALTSEVLEMNKYRLYFLDGVYILSRYNID